jgi:hypothetical protein
MSYADLEREAERPKAIRDWTARWEQLPPVASVNGDLEQRVQLFCESKLISLEALAQLDARVAVRRGGGVWLAFAGRNGDGVVTAIKYRLLGAHEFEAEQPSTWLRPIVIGKRDSLAWAVVEGETDAAWFWDRLGDEAAILVLPTGARTFRAEWASGIPRGATVYLCHDADADGDAGAEKAARIVGGETVRVRPPLEGGDWCEWGGQREQLLELLRDSRAQGDTPTFLRLDKFLAAGYPPAEVLLGDPETIVYLARGTFALTYGDGGAGKSTFEVDAVAHLAAGRTWLGIPVPRPVRVLVIENENAPALFQQKLDDKVERWDADPSWRENVYVWARPWGKFTFARAEDRRHLRDFCDEELIDLITVNPLFGVGGPGSGRPDETSAFVELLKELGLGLDGPAIWPLHHQNKLGQVSGDWNRQPDTLVALAREGDSQATKLSWEKVRWTRQAPEGWRKKWLLEWVVEHKGYKVIDVDLRAASDAELEERIDDYLSANPRSSKNTIETEVKGNGERIRKLLDAGVEAGRYVREKGFRSAQLHSLADDLVRTLDDLADDLGGNPHG